VLTFLPLLYRTPGSVGLSWTPELRASFPGTRTGVNEDECEYSDTDETVVKFTSA
jgi:hypothetical protein